MGVFLEVFDKVEQQHTAFAQLFAFQLQQCDIIGM